MLQPVEIHEAGHAVAHWALTGQAPLSVSVSDVMGGKVVWGTQNQRDAFATAQVLMSGLAAECAIDPTLDFDSLWQTEAYATDRQNFDRLVGVNHEHAQTCARNLMQSYLPQVRALAAELSRRLERNSRREIYTAGMRQPTIQRLLESVAG
jgi:hypothetical protein